MHVAELAVPARLLLEARMLRHRFANGFFVRHFWNFCGQRDTVFYLQAVERDAQMHFALSPQNTVVGDGNELEEHGRVFLAQFGDRRG